MHRDGTRAPAASLTVVQADDLGGSDSWQFLSHSGSHWGRRNDAGFGLAAQPHLPTHVGDSTDSDEAAHANAEWIARCRAWHSGKRAPCVDGQVGRRAPHVASSLGLPPVGYVLDVRQHVDKLKRRSWILTCARYFYPEDTAAGRRPWHGAADMFLALEHGCVGDGERYRLMTCELQVGDLASIMRAAVHVNPSQNFDMAAHQQEYGWTPTSAAVPRCLRFCYCLDDDTYSSLGPALNFVRAWSNAATDRSFVLEPCHREPCSGDCNNDKLDDDISQAIHDPAGVKPTQICAREHVIGRYLYVLHAGSRDLAFSGNRVRSDGGSASSADERAQRGRAQATGPVLNMGAWDCGRVLAYNASSGEHFVEYDADEQRGEWLYLTDQSVQWLEGTEPFLSAEADAPFFLSWTPSGGCWLAVMEEMDEFAKPADASLDAYTGALPLARMLSRIQEVAAYRPFDLPSAVRGLLDVSIPASASDAEAPELRNRPSHEKPDDPPAGESGRTGLPRPLADEESCARARVWCKADHNGSLHRLAVPAAQGGFADTLDESHSSDNADAAARARKSRSEARRFRGSGCGALRSLWEDGRLEKGGAGTGSRRLRFGRSQIQGWGVYTDEHIGVGEAVLEYRGELIGNAVADLRERCYRREKRDDYMFRIDDNFVVDATRRGSLARYVNHSCDPNCFTRITEYGSKKKKIIIYAKRDIHTGEELKYDYKFTTEYALSKKIPCNCGAANCKGFMN